MANSIKLGTLVKHSASGTFFRLRDIQYNITEYYTKEQIIKDKQLSNMKVLQFKIIAELNLLHVNVKE